MQQERRGQYKNQGKDPETLRKNRVETSVNIRKDKREETLTKRRNIPTASIDSDDASTSAGGLSMATGRENLGAIVENARSGDPETQLAAVQQARYAFFV